MYASSSNAGTRETDDDSCVLPRFPQARINNDVGEYVGKKYWTQASNELRRQVGTLRFDVNNLVENKGADSADAKAFYAKLENLDFALRQKDQDAATALLADVQSTATALLASLA